MIPLAPQRSRASGDGTPAPSGQISKAAFFRTRPSHAHNGSLHSHTEISPEEVPPNTERNYNANRPSLDTRTNDSRQPVQNALLGTMSPPTTQGHSPATQYADQFRDPPSEMSHTSAPGRQHSQRYGSTDSRNIASPDIDSSSALHHSSSRTSSRMGQAGRSYGLNQFGGHGDSSHVTGESANLLMNLLAGQAAIDCQGLPVSRWEEVEEWKRVSNALPCSRFASSPLNTGIIHVDIAVGPTSCKTSARAKDPYCGKDTGKAE
jgi:hypothetical protein